MSIINYHPIIKKIFEDNHKKNEVISQKKWILIFLETKFYDKHDKIERYLRELTVLNIKKEITIDKIYIYTYPHPKNKTFYENFILRFNINLIEIPVPSNIKIIKLIIINKFVNCLQNIIFFDYGCGYINTNDLFNLSKINQTDTIYTNFMSINNINNINISMLQQINLEEIINSDTMIIPFSRTNQDYINNTLQIANDLKTEHEDFTSNISLTIINIKLKNPLTDIQDEIFSINFISFIDNKITYNMIRELYAIKDILPRAGTNFALEEFIEYDHNNYLFYPYLDIDLNLTKIIKPIVLSHSEINSLSKCDKLNSPGLPKIFNTNGFYAETDPNEKIYLSMFKRFDDGNSGIFIKKIKNKIIAIPRILHYIWFNISEPIQNYVNIWGRILREPWKYVIWSKDKINEYILKNNTWSQIYRKETDNDLKLLIIYFAILEEYGGIIINSFVVPLKLIPDELLTNKFVMSFLNEKLFGTKLSYQIMASIPGLKKEIRDFETKCDLARRPFEGVNNFFRDIKQKNKNKNKNKNNVTSKINVNDGVYTSIFDDLLKIMSSGENNKLEIIENILMTNSDVSIYPSYYFNFNNYIFPKHALNFTICTCLQKNTTSYPRNKTDIKRIYKVTPTGIIAKLNENPKDKFKK